MQTTKAANTLWHQILCKIARQKKFGLAKRFQSTAEKSAPTEVQNVRVCKQRRPTKGSGAKISARMKHVKSSAHAYRTLRGLSCFKKNHSKATALRLPIFARKLSAKKHIPVSRLQTRSSSENKHNYKVEPQFDLMSNCAKLKACTIRQQGKLSVRTHG